MTFGRYRAGLWSRRTKVGADFAAGIRVPVTGLTVLVALALTGAIGAHVGGSSKVRASLRVVRGGAVALVVTYGIGRALGASGVV